MMREDLESKGPVRLSEVDAQQKAILLIVRRLATKDRSCSARRAKMHSSDVRSTRLNAAAAVSALHAGCRTQRI